MTILGSFGPRRGLVGALDLEGEVGREETLPKELRRALPGMLRGGEDEEERTRAAGATQCHRNDSTTKASASGCPGTKLPRDDALAKTRGTISVHSRRVSRDTT